MIRVVASRAAPGLTSSLTALVFLALVAYALLGMDLLEAWREVTIIVVVAGCSRLLVKRGGVALSMGIGVLVAATGLCILLVWAVSRI